jgi:hypothetical protein
MIWVRLPPCTKALVARRHCRQETIIRVRTRLVIEHAGMHLTILTDTRAHTLHNGSLCMMHWDKTIV